VTLARDTFTAITAILLRQTTFAKAQEAGQIRIEGRAEKLTELLGLLDNFEPMFSIVTPRAPQP
jgi:alkyl sulfatase BDS1-like metallo-beta-lactamase superfamily hydrolase